MPTPVGVARQCLAKEAAAALDDAIVVAKCRKHGQTTSLHVVSALLTLPSSLLRDACTRSRNLAYSQRLQFRALELCVGVALDRVLVSKTGGDEPPVSNSLMAAIKRSQANQRRHPETFLIYQQQLNSNPDSPPSISAVKVELKHFVMSILDDPIVSRVFGDAGFQTQEMKFTILSPPAISRFLSTLSRPPPQFLSSLSDYKQTKLASNFPFLLDDGDGKIGGNTKRISEVLLKPNRRNPLLIGACASDAYTNFLDSFNTETGIVILPKEIEGFRSLISLEYEVSEFITGRLSEEILDLKLKQIDEKIENRQRLGIIAHFGDLIALVNAESFDLVSCLVTKLKKSLLNSSGKLWLIGFLAGDEVYKKLVDKIPSIETDWDLNLLPITSSAIGGKCLSSSNLMRTFVPLGGFFSIPSELGISGCNATQTQKLCNWCSEKFEQEVSAAQKGESVTDKQSESQSSWLQIGKISNSSEIKEGKSVFDVRVSGLRSKWGDICQKLHSLQKSPSGSMKKFPFSIENETHQNLDLNVTTDLRLGMNDGEMCKKQNLTDIGKEFEGLWKDLGEKIHWQIDAIRVLNRAVSNWNHKDDNNKGCLWLTFLGSDQVGKRKTAELLSEIVFGPNGNFLCIDVSIESAILSSDSILNRYYSKLQRLKPGRKLVVDCIAEDLRKHPNSVVFLENIDKADVLIQESLSLAIKTGKFRDSCGRIINIQGTMFVLESRISNLITVEISCDEVAAEFPVEKVVEARNLPMQLSFISPSHDTRKQKYTANIWTTRNDARRSPVNKRKMGMNNEISFKRPCKLYRSQIDLNLPVIDNEVVDIDTSDEDTSRGSSNDQDSFSSSISWLQELLENVNENVVFKPFDFDSAAQEVVMMIDLFVRGDGVCLEIDENVMFQILAAIWLGEDKKGLEVWIENVVCRSIREARRRRCWLTASSGTSSEVVMKLEHYFEGEEAIEELEGGLCLPASIHIC